VDREVIATSAVDRLRPLLAESGIRLFAFETIVQVPPEDQTPLTRAAAALAGFDWIVFTSKSAVEALLAHCEFGQPPEGPRIACVGEATAAAAARQGAVVDLVPGHASGAALARALLPRLSSRSRILWPRAERAGQDLSQILEQAGHLVQAPIAYRTQAPRPSPKLDADRRQLLEGFRNERFCAITLLSPSAVDNLGNLIGAAITRSILSTLVIAAIGQTTAAHLAQRYRTPDIIPSTPSIEGLVSALVKELKERFP